MNEINFRKLIVRELKGDATPEESHKINLWIEDNVENQRVYDELWSAYQLASPGADIFVADREEAWMRIVKRISGRQSGRSIWLQFSKIAAAAVLFFCLGIAIEHYLGGSSKTDFSQQYSTVIVPAGQKSNLVLPDGSTVWLNSGTTLRYRTDFNSKLREVELTGEAYFDVKKDPNRMFRVNTGTINVEVYGTQFNVKNYKEDKNLEVSVESGRVGILKDGEKLTELLKGKQALYAAGSNELLLNNAKIDVVTAWKNNEMVFDGTPFEEVIKYLERWYGVTITIEEKMKKNHNYTFKVKTESMKELLELIKKITPLQYRIDGKNVTIRYAN